jgi:hypothetical protein
MTLHHLDPVGLWEDVLRAFEESLDEQRVYLQLVDADPTGSSAPGPGSLAPPMPQQFAGWAQSLLRETQGLVDMAAAVLDALPVPSARPFRSPAHAGAATARPTWDRNM